MWRYLLMSSQTLNLVLVDFYFWLDVDGYDYVHTSTAMVIIFQP